MHISIIDLNLNPWVVQLASDLRQIFLGIFNYLAININQYCFLHARVLHHFTDHTTVSASYYKHMLRIRMRKKCRVGHHLMINKFVLNRSHYHAIKYEHSPKLLGIKHRQILKIRFLRNQSFTNFGCNTKDRCLLLSKPQFHRSQPSFRQNSV
ncbi:hypothetical protein D3C73_1202590 [compost metagenome]